MKDLIINSFYFNKIQTLDSLLNYSKVHYNFEFNENVFKKFIEILLYNNILIENEKEYLLSKTGRVILDNNMNYYHNIIYNFIRNKIYTKKYKLEIKRKELIILRLYLIKHKKQKCFICKKKLPLSLLETTYLKFRCLLTKQEISDMNVVEFFCSYCHILYNRGFLAIYNNKLYVSKKIDKNIYDTDYNKLKHQRYSSTYSNKKYLDFHYKIIYCKDKKSNLFFNVVKNNST